MKTGQQEQAAAAFAQKWAGRGYEKGESQKFWLELLTEVLGVERPFDWIEFEEQVKLDHTSFIDGHIRRTHVLIEQKSLGRDLRAPIRQSDGSLLSPFQQAKRYASELPYSQRPRWIVTCNFSDFFIYDMEQPNGEPEHIALEHLAREYYRLRFLVDTGDAHIQREMEVSLQAGRMVGMLYDKLLEQYHDKTSAESLRSLNILCVRLVFCLYAEDAGVFPGHDMFHNYLAGRPAAEVRRALLDLFRVLDTKPEDRDPYMDERLAAFPYVNGGLFSETAVEVPRFTQEIVTMLLENASLGFDWSGISPTIFGAVFESTLNPETRRSGGMHYTSIENIHKVIDPLFLDALREELGTTALLPSARARVSSLKALQTKLAGLTFLDPACGSGNFLTETYISLRRLENEIIQILNDGQSVLGFNSELSPVKVSISQFYGIEINDFAVTVARTALWIAEHQMLKETQKIVAHDLDFLPLKSYNNIREGDALKIDWRTLGSEGTPAFANTNDAQYASCEAKSGLTPSIPNASMFYDRTAYLAIRDGYHLPHWHQDGKLQFITFRLADSLPQEIIQSIKQEKATFEAQHPAPWDDATQSEYHKLFDEKTEAYHAAGYGSCVLADEKCRDMVVATMMHDNGSDYILHSFVIMPNHVHVLVEMLGETDVAETVGMWKGISARSINQLRGTHGKVWQSDFFDRMIRSQQHYQHVQDYIRHNTAPHAYHWNGSAVGSAVLGEGKSAFVPCYIIGNPPFVGYSLQSKEQKEAMLSVYVDERGKPYKTAGKIDFVAAWFFKAAQLMHTSPQTRTAFVATNSITQGEQVAAVWMPLFQRFGIKIDFAHRTFQWDSESDMKAHVHCVIVGFSGSEGTPAFANKRNTQRCSGEGKSAFAPKPIIFDGERRIMAKNINAYLLDGPDVFVESRSKSLCDVPQMVYGNKPVDGGFFFLKGEELDDFLKAEPAARKFIRRIYGAEEYINNKERYCLWLKDATPAELRSMPKVMERIRGVRDFRLASPKEATRRIAETPTLFQEDRQPNSEYIIVPSVSSENRRYVPMGFVQPEIIVNNAVLIIPNATLYHFGVLTSNVHMAWMRAVCGRLKSDYRYSKDVVYNNFPWPGSDGTSAFASPHENKRDVCEGKSAFAPNEAPGEVKSDLAPHVEVITRTAQAILDARALYPDASLADLYDEAVMPVELRRAHQANDRAVMQAYGFPIKGFTEQDCVAHLMEMYKAKTT